MRRDLRAVVCKGLGSQWEAWLVSDGGKVEPLVVGCSKREAVQVARIENRRRYQAELRR